jgi:hypothetical protein
VIDIEHLLSPLQLTYLLFLLRNKTGNENSISVTSHDSSNIGSAGQFLSRKYIRTIPQVAKKDLFVQVKFDYQETIALI